MLVNEKNTLNRLKRAEGQLRGVQKMVKEEQEPFDIVTQLSAVRSSVDRLMGMIAAENLKNCLQNPAEDPEEQAHKLDEAIKMIVKK